MILIPVRWIMEIQKRKTSVIPTKDSSDISRCFDIMEEKEPKVPVYMAICELRPGNQHCQKGTPEFITRAIEALQPSAKGKNILYRFDSGNESMTP